jgi:inner membrane protein YidH
MPLADDKAHHTTKSDLFIRDHLAGYRTELANRRTLLAYIRTVLSLVAAALVFIKFWQHPIVIVLGWVLLPIAAVILIRGLLIYRRINRVVRREEKKTGETEGPFR